VWRIYWYDFARRLGPIFDSDQGRSPSSWNLPRSANEGERLLSDLGDDPQRPLGWISIAAQSNDGYEALADACRTLNLNPIRFTWSKSEVAHTFTAGLWDARSGDETEWSQIRRFATAIEPSPVIVIQGFPRRDEYERAASSGIGVLAKPFQLPDLWRALGATATIEKHLKHCSPSP
jgi:hypothetical protein